MAKEKQTKKNELSTMEKNSANSRSEKVLGRGRVFEGKVISKHPKRVAIEFERTIFIRKYERFTKHKTRIHARLPDAMTDQVHIGDVIQVQECRPLSKIIHAIVIKVIRKNEKPQTTEKTQ